MKGFNGMGLLVRLILMTIIILFIPLQAVQSDEPVSALSPSELKALARVISAEDPRYDSLMVEATFDAPSIKTAIGFHVYYHKTNGYALNMRDMTDGTPIFLLADETALLYDPSVEELILFQDVGLLFELKMDDSDLHFVSAFRTREQGVQPKIVNTLMLDLVSIFDKVVVHLRAERMDEGVYVLLGETELGNLCVAEIDPSALIPFLKIGFYRKGEPGPLLAFSRLEANGNIDSAVFRFPMKDLMDRGLAVKTVAADQEHFINLMTFMGRVLFIRSALAFPEMRQGLGQLGIHDSDWPVIEKRDKRVSQILKDMFGEK